jgi:very-short-patch-repair endonuclease
MSKLENIGKSRLSSSPLGGEPNRAAPKPEQSAKPRPRFGGGYYQQKNINHARDMRKDLTPWELQLWLRLKSKQLGGYKFRRQQPIGRYIVDFVNIKNKLIIELDGSQHLDSEDDKRRDAYLVKEGYRVLRFWNNDVNANIEGVLAAILSALESYPPPNRADRVEQKSNAGASRNLAPPQGGSYRARGEIVPYTSTCSASRFAVNSEEIIEHKHATACSPLEGEPNCSCDLVGGNSA